MTPAGTPAPTVYYAAFYAVSALLVKGGRSAAKHSGVRALFNQHYVKIGVTPKSDGRLYSRLFDLRQEGDYIDFVYLDAAIVEPLIAQTAAFIQRIHALAA